MCLIQISFLTFCLFLVLSNMGGKNASRRGIVFDCGGAKPRLLTNMCFESRFKGSHLKWWSWEGSRQSPVGWQPQRAVKNYNQRTANWMASVVSKPLPVFPPIKSSQFSQSVWSMSTKAWIWQVLLGIIIRRLICNPPFILKCSFGALFSVCGYF